MTTRRQRYRRGMRTKLASSPGSEHDQRWRIKRARGIMAGLDHARLPGRGPQFRHDLWFDQSIFHGRGFSRVLTVLPATLMVALFAIDMFVRPPISVGALHGFAIFMAAIHGRRSWMVATALASAALPIPGYERANQMTPAAMPFSGVSMESASRRSFSSWSCAA